jgi:hydrogenase maturation protease
VRYLIGIGNWSMGDDGVGLRVVERIDRDGLARGFEAVEIADDGLRLVDYCAPETERIVLVDAVELGLPPGEWRLFRPEEVYTRKPLTGLSTHEGDILKVLDFARKLGYPVPPVVILGIQPEQMEIGMELSETLRGRFEEYIRIAVEEAQKA